jgi:hypothetical protein
LSTADDFGALRRVQENTRVYLESPRRGSLTCWTQEIAAFEKARGLVTSSTTPGYAGVSDPLDFGIDIVCFATKYQRPQRSDRRGDRSSRKSYRAFRRRANMSQARARNAERLDAPLRMTAHYETAMPGARLL